MNPPPVSFHAILAILLIGLSALTPAVLAQDDLSIPGETTTQTAPAPAAPSSSSSDGASASQGQTTLWGLIKAGVWAMWILGAFSIAVVGLAIYNLIDLKPKNFYPDEVIAALETDIETLEQDWIDWGYEWMPER